MGKIREMLRMDEKENLKYKKKNLKIRQVSPLREEISSEKIEGESYLTRKWKHKLSQGMRANWLLSGKTLSNTYHSTMRQI